MCIIFTSVIIIEHIYYLISNSAINSFIYSYQIIHSLFYKLTHYFTKLTHYFILINI